MQSYTVTSLPSQFGLVSNYSAARVGRKEMEVVPRKKALLILNCILLTVGNCGGPLIIRLYFLRGGKRIWLSSWIQTAGFPIILITLFVSYMNRRWQIPINCTAAAATTELFLMKTRVLIASAIIGIITGLSNYVYGYGLARLPVSTSSLLVSTQLAFTAGFAFLLVKQKFTAFSINAIILLTVGAAVLALHTSSDRPKGESKEEYVLGFVFTLAGAALGGFIMPSLELTYLKAKQAVTYRLVLEIQLVICLFATAFSTVGMIINKDFQAISKEGKQYELGETKYFLVLVWVAIILQGFFLGIVGVIFYGSSLLAGIIITVSIPITELLAVIFFHEKFQVEKGVALFLSLWGFVSYFFGEMKQNKKTNCRTEGTEMARAGEP